MAKIQTVLFVLYFIGVFYCAALVVKNMSTFEYRAGLKQSSEILTKSLR